MLQLFIELIKIWRQVSAAKIADIKFVSYDIYTLVSVESDFFDLSSCTIQVANFNARVHFRFWEMNRQFDPFCAQLLLPYFSKRHINNIKKSSMFMTSWSQWLFWLAFSVYFQAKYKKQFDVYDLMITVIFLITFFCFFFQASVTQICMYFTDLHFKLKSFFKVLNQKCIENFMRSISYCFLMKLFSGN